MMAVRPLALWGLSICVGVVVVVLVAQAQAAVQVSTIYGNHKERLGEPFP